MGKSSLNLIFQPFSWAMIPVIFQFWFHPHPPWQEHHTHVVLVDAGSRREEAFGTEVDMREALERYATGPGLANERSGNSFGIWSVCLETQCFKTGIMNKTYFDTMENSKKFCCSIER